jgi:hypothetical protein
MAEGWGGARQGAGRKLGSKLVKKTAKTAIEKAADAALLNGEVPAEITKLRPLDVLLRAMWIAAAQCNWNVAASFAEKSAPYVHAKMSSVDLNATVKKDVSALTDDEILALLTKANAKLPTEDKPSATVN